MAEIIRREAVRIVIQEERAAGRTPVEIASSHLEKKLGCDLISTEQDSGEKHFVEVKGWGVPFRSKSDKFNYFADMRASQIEAAGREPGFRLEIVANLTAYIAGEGAYERLTLSGEEVLARAKPQIYWIDLADFEGRIRRG